MAALLSEYLVDGLSVFVAYLSNFSSLFKFDLLVVDHVKQVLSLLVADASVSFHIFNALFLHHLLRGVFGLGVVLDALVLATNNFNDLGIFLRNS